MRMCKEGIKDTQISVSQRGGFLGQVQQIADYDINQHPKVISIKVFISATGGEKKI